MIESTISIGTAENLVLLLGTKDQHLKQIRSTIPANISTRDGKILVQGDEADVIKATAVLEELRMRLRQNGSLNADAVSQVIRRVANGENKLSTDPIGVGSGRSILPRTRGQADYVQAIRDNALVFCTGPAGTGKTYLAVATAVEALQAQRIRKIVLVRPAVEAGESLGYLPGDLGSKNQSLLAALARRVGRNDGLRSNASLHGRRCHRSRTAGVHARQDAQPCIHHFG